MGRPARSISLAFDLLPALQPLGEKAGVLRKLLEALARGPEERGGIDLTECFIDGTFTVAKKGALKSERLSGAKVRSSWSLQRPRVFHSPCRAPKKSWEMLNTAQDFRMLCSQQTNTYRITTKLDSL